MFHKLKLEFSEWLSAEPQGPSLRALPLFSTPRVLVADTVCSKSALRQFWQPFSRAGKLRGQASMFALSTARCYQANAEMWRELSENVGALVGEEVALAALMMGTSGAYQKLTGLLVDKNGVPFACVKMARHSLAQEQLRNEQSRLASLNALPNLAESLPKLFGMFLWRDWQCLALSFGQGRVSDGRMNPSVLEFLSRLRAATAQEQRVGDSHWWQLLNAEVDKLNDRLPALWQSRFSRGMVALSNQLADRRAIFATVHGDFAPWNIRIQAQGAFVFDWESARAGVPCWFDYFHFDVIQAANAGRRCNVVASSNKWLETLAPAITASDLFGLYLAYLLDVSLFYARARVLVPQQGTGHTWEWLGREIDSLLVRA